LALKPKTFRDVLLKPRLGRAQRRKPELNTYYYSKHLKLSSPLFAGLRLQRWIRPRGCPGEKAAEGVAPFFMKLA
jgi:hypothetical protein